MSIEQKIHELLQEEIKINCELWYLQKCEEVLDGVIEGITMRRQEVEKEVSNDETNTT